MTTAAHRRDSKSISKAMLHDERPRAAVTTWRAEYGMFEHFKRYPWVLETYTYPSSERLIADLGERVIGPAEDYARSIADPRLVQVEEPGSAIGKQRGK